MGFFEPRKAHRKADHEVEVWGDRDDPPSTQKADFFLHVPWSKVAILGMVISPLIGNPYNGYINPYYWVDDHPLLYGNNGSLDPGTHVFCWWRKMVWGFSEGE